MKKVKVLLTAAALSLFMFTISCDKDKTENKTEPEVSEKCHLTQIKWQEDDDVVRFEYDNNNRLVKIVEGDGYYELISYNSQNQIEKIVSIDEGEEYLRAFYNWEVKKLTITSEAKTEEGVWEQEQYKTIADLDANGHTTKERHLRLTESEWVEYYYLDLTWIDGNLIRSEYWRDHDVKETKAPLIDRMNFFNLFSYSSKDFVKEGTTTIEYDDKNNLFGAFVGYYDINQSKNNILKLTTTNTNGEATEFLENTYDYNDEGYPSKMVMRWVYFDTEDISTVFLEYDCH